MTLHVVWRCDELKIMKKYDCPDSMKESIKVNQSHYRPEVPRGFQEVKGPRLCDSGPGWW
jgi:hypothetical protein